MRRITAGLLAAAVGGSMLLTAGPALAAPPAELKVDLTRVQPDPVVVKKDKITRVAIDVVSKGATRVEVTLKPLSPRFSRFPAKEARSLGRDNHGFRGRGKEEIRSFVASFDAKDPAGRWLATAVAFDRSGKKVLDSENFTVELAKSKFNTRIVKFGAFPQKVRVGKPVFFRGTLLATPERVRPRGYAGQEVAIRYRSHERARWRTLGEVRTDRSGTFKATVRAFKTGEYKAVFVGNDDANGTDSNVVSVRVKRGFHHFRW